MGPPTAAVPRDPIDATPITGEREAGTTETARRDLESWKAAFPADPFEADGPLRRILAGRLPAGRLAALEDRAGRFGRSVVADIAPAARRFEQRAHLPKLAQWDAFGRRVEHVEFDPAYHEAGAAVWASGLVAMSAEPGRAFEQATLLYLLSLEGEAGHACPATCTIGLARALRGSQFEVRPCSSSSASPSATLPSLP